MKIVFCNITYLNNYTGITEEDTPYKGGKWVEENRDAHEQWNFLNYNGNCYGFVMNPGEQFSIERIDEKSKTHSSIEDVTVVWCAAHNNETVIVGWYEHATFYRNYQNSIVTPLYGLDRSYCCKADANDCYLLPEESRTFTIGRASIDGKGKGFGQQNYWYAESSYARSELIPKVIEFFEAHKHERINYTSSAFKNFKNETEKLTASEKKITEELYNLGKYLEFLPYGYRRFYNSESADNAFYIADALAALFQFGSAIEWYEKVFNIEGKTWENLSYMPYVYQQNENHAKAISTALELLEYSEASDTETKHEIYGIIADSYFYLNNISEAILWLDKILSESTNKELLEYTALTKEELSKLL